MTANKHQNRLYRACKTDILALAPSSTEDSEQLDAILMTALTQTDS